MKQKLTMVAVILTTLAIETPRSWAQSDVKETKATWRIVQSSLPDGETIARFVLEPVASGQSTESSRDNRRIAVWLSKASPLLRVAREQPGGGDLNNKPRGLTLDMSSTNELKTLVPLLVAYDQVIQAAGRIRAWEVEQSAGWAVGQRLIDFAFGEPVTQKSKTNPETREHEMALDAAFVRLQATGQAYVGSLGKPVRLDVNQSDLSMSAIMFAPEDNNLPWITLFEPEALLFAFQNISELKKTHETLVAQQQTRKAEAERLLLARRHSEKDEQEQSNQKREAEAPRKPEPPANSSIARDDPNLSNAQQQVARSKKTKVRPDELLHPGPWGVDGVMPIHAAAPKGSNNQNELKSGESIQTGHKQSDDDSSVTIKISRIWLAIVAIVSLIAVWFYLRFRRVRPLMAKSVIANPIEDVEQSQQISSKDSVASNPPTTASTTESALVSKECGEKAPLEWGKMHKTWKWVSLVLLIVGIGLIGQGIFGYSELVLDRQDVITRGWLRAAIEKKPEWEVVPVFKYVRAGFGERIESIVSGVFSLFAAFIAFGAALPDVSISDANSLRLRPTAKPLRLIPPK